MTPDALIGGFTDAPVQASHAFRAALNALSRPGQIETLHGASAPAPLSSAAATLAMTLFDGTTPVHLAGAHNSPALRDWITFHTGAPLVDAHAASGGGYQVDDRLSPFLVEGAHVELPHNFVS